MRKVFFIFVTVLLYVFGIYGQEGHFYVHIPNKADVPLVSDLKSSSKLEINVSNLEEKQIYEKYEVYTFKKAFPTAVTPFLQEIYEVECNSTELMYELNNNFASKYPLVEEIMEPILLYEPNDYGSNGGWTTEQSNLDLIQAPQAWDITKGSLDVVIGVSDTDFDVDHEDLENKIIQVRGSNTYTGNSHGTRVAGVLSADTDNGLGIAGTAFNCPLLVSSNWASNNEMLLIAQSGVRIINASWINSCTFSNVAWAIYEEIRNDNNTVVVAGAGNNPSHCGSNTAYVYPASYDNVISVTSVGHEFPRGHSSGANWEDCHESIIGDTTSTHHHNDLVNISAPGYKIPVTRHTDEGLYGVAWGTSHASPQVAGACGLVLSVNPCLTANEVQTVLENTADNIYNIPENAQYIGLLGAGRVNAHQAVLEAIDEGTVINSNSIYSGTHTFTAPTIFSGGGRVTSGSDITFQAPYEVEMRPGFEVEAGAEFEVVMEHTCPF